MTIDEAIIHCEEVAIRKLKNGNNANCVQCGEEHIQLAKWLKELRDYKSREDVVPVVHGKWIVSHIPDSMLWECDQCGFDCGAHSFNFCPKCGAKMDGGKS